MTTTRHLSDRWVVLLALCAAAGAAASLPVPWGLVVVSLVLATALRHPAAWCVVAFVLVSCLGARSWQGVEPVPGHRYTGTATLLTDPESSGPATRAEVRAEGHRFDAWFRGGAGGRVRALLAGERIEVEGTITPRRPDATWLARRHIVGRLSVSAVGQVHPASTPGRVANRLRRAVDVGATSLEGDHRALLLGVLMGDDREQSATVADDFQGAGLGHLLAVSGENVAFLLVALGPVLRRLNLPCRLALTLAALGGFALLTRFEPSVLRATTMAAIAATGVAVGRPAPALRHLALAVTILLVVDPLLVGVLGFQLSVAASASILVLGPRLASRCPGPRWLAEPLAVTVAAQAGVAPILLLAFGGLPVVAVPANLLAGPAVAPLTVWGMTAGVVAGAVGGPLAAVLHLPTRVLTGWLLVVAREATALRLGDLRGRDVALVAVGGMLWWCVASGPSGVALRRVGGCLVVVACLLPGIELRHAPPPVVDVADGVEVWRAGATVVVVRGPARADDALEGLRRAGVGKVSLLVDTSTGWAGAEATTALVRRYQPATVWSATGPPGRGAPIAGSRWRVGDLVVTVLATDGSLAVSVDAVGQEAGTGPVLASLRAPPTRSAPVRHLHPGRGHGDPQPHARLLLRRRQLLRVR